MLLLLFSTKLLKITLLIYLCHSILKSSTIKNYRMKIGIIGAGAIGTTIAKHLAGAGYEIVISNSRGADTLKEKFKQIGGNIIAGSVQEAAGGDVVFLAVRWENAQEVLSSVSLEDKILIDVTNASLPEFVRAEPGRKTSSEVVGEWAKGAKVVKAFNTLYASVLAKNPQAGGGNRVIFYSGNNDDAKAVVSGIINRIGFVGVDLVSLQEGGKLQRFPGGPLPTLNLIKLK
ncbi:putative dinucleotide-binding enzyme [Chryseobacterium ginsenosidimutans]|uniref:NADPH-dependent F420 reductase n=1 Tax=Chryseobacterium ginsenosidimutans TaxID=687846 RepID=UPI0027815BDF|nr:NAD(P)-binding domain-containing protein [Chryseobacterium ginsenosidimutans]MDQ0595255.1 putative dinucleotide-binding enzyme [Chryseobacterium ginsenosidimutans]